MSVHGIDYDQDQIELARKLQGERNGLRFAVEDAADMSFDNASFDLVVSQNVFHHIPNWWSVVREVARVLRPGGFLIWLDLVTPKTLRGIVPRMATKSGVYTFEEVRSAFAESGFEERFHTKLFYGLVFHHDMILQKT